MKNKCIYIDFDGVILDSEERMLERKFQLGLRDNASKAEFIQYFEYTKNNPQEWDYIIREANEINDSVKIIKELESKKVDIAILTKIHTIEEMKIKIDDLRNHRNIKCPVIFVPQGVSKHEIIIPNGQLLIDDSEKNISKWINNGGTGYIFDKNIPENTKQRVRSLDFLIKR